jgi:thiamine-monophosphate kinase
MTRPGARGPRAIDERSFHAWLAATARPPRPGELPLGDDVAALPVPGGIVLLTTDAFTEGTHFLPSSPPVAIGRALVESNFSDLASKGAIPVAFLLDLLVPRGTPELWARGIVRGVRAALRPYRLDLAGGDTKPAAGRTLVGTAVGFTRNRRLPRRDRARVGDLLAVTGVVGRGGRIALLSSDRRPGASPSGPRAMLGIHARVAEGRRLARYAHSMLDTSDGLFESVHLLAGASQVSVELDADRIPYDAVLLRQVRNPARRLAIAAFGGDYELVAALSRSRFEHARRELASLGCRLTVVGAVRRGHGASVDLGGRRIALPHAGWDPFRRTGARRGD